MSAPTLGGVGALPAEAQTGNRLPPSADGVGASDKLVITVSPSGRGADQPTQPDMRIPKLHADAALEGFNAGAGIVHLRGWNYDQGEKLPPGQPMIRRPDLENWR